MFLAEPERLPEGLVATSSVRDLAPHEFLYHRGDPATAVHVVINGRVRSLCVSSEGKQLPLYVVRSGECVSEHCLFAETYCSDVIAEVHSQVRAFPQDALRRTLLEYPKLSVEFMSLQTQRFNRIRLSLELRSLRSARARITQYLLASSLSGTVRLDRPLRYMAEDLGLSHETFYRILRRLVDEGVVIRTARTLQLSEKKPTRSKANASKSNSLAEVSGD
jgi:CRP/FNR family transcriptional regulator, dissimilatory nitrate respiration regulator